MLYVNRRVLYFISSFEEISQMKLRKDSHLGYRSVRNFYER